LNAPSENLDGEREGRGCISLLLIFSQLFGISCFSPIRVFVFFRINTMVN
jgi:hypothetical protein